MRIDESNLEWVLQEAGVRWRLKSRPTTAYRIAALHWCHGYTPPAAAAEVGVAPASAARYLRRLRKRIRDHRAALDAGETVGQVMDRLLEEEAEEPPVSEHAKNLLACHRNRQGSADHPPALSRNVYTGEWESRPLHPPACSQREAEAIVRDLAARRSR